METPTTYNAGNLPNAQSYMTQGGDAVIYNPSDKSYTTIKGGKTAEANDAELELNDSVIQTTSGIREETQKNVQGFTDLNTKIAQNNLQTSGATDGAPKDSTSTAVTTATPSQPQQKQTFVRINPPPGWTSQDTPTGGQILTSDKGENVYTNPNDNPALNQAVTAGQGGATPPAEPEPDTEDPMSGMKSQIETIHSAAEQQINNVKTTLQQTLAYVDANTAATIGSLRMLYDERISSVKDSYKRLAAKKRQVGYRNGLERYAPDQAEGVVTDVEVQGEIKVANLLAKMNDAITRATSAQSANNMKAFNSAYKEINAIQKSMTTEVNNLYKAAVQYKNAQTKALREEQLQSSREISDNVRQSNAVAPFLASELEGKSKSERQKFLKAYAEQEGIDLGVLSGAVEKAGLSARNTKSIIAKRGTTGGGVEKPLVDGKIKYTKADLGAIEAKMPRGSDNFVDTAVYSKMYQNWLKLGGTASGFIKLFPPKTHLNPSDDSVPAIFKQYLKKPAKADDDEDSNLF